MASEVYARQPAGPPTLRARLRRIRTQANEAFEFFCVYFVAYVNWFFAFGFIAAYLAITLTIFQGRDELPVCQ